jgi:hypothetical protein
MSMVDNCRELVKKLELHTEVLDETPGFILSKDDITLIVNALNFAIDHSDKKPDFAQS